MALLTGIGLSVLLGFVPMLIFAVLLTWFDRYEKEPFWLVSGVFLWGLVVAAGSALIINTALNLGLLFAVNNEGLANVGTATLVAPPVEETVKGLAVLTVFIYFRREFDSLLDGIIYGGLVGFGFAAAENINYIFSGYAEGNLEGLLAVAAIRNFLIPFLHAFLTGFTGLGLAVARLNRGWIRFVAPPAGFLIAVFLHFLHNLLASLGSLACLLGSLLDWMGFLGMFAFIVILVWREGIIVRDQLREEIAFGTLTEAQYQTARSLVGQTLARWSGLARGQWFTAGRFYDLCGRLAFKKYALRRVGPEPGLPADIAALRRDIAALSPHVGK